MLKISIFSYKHQHFVKENGESCRMFQIILVFWLGIIKIMYLFDIGMFELGMVLLVFDLCMF